MKKDDQKLDRLKRIHEAGFKKFVLIRGVCCWGFPFGLIMCVLLFFDFGIPEGYELPDRAYFKLAPLIFVLSVIGGAIWGVLMWLYLMKLYKQMANKQKND